MAAYSEEHRCLLNDCSTSGNGCWRRPVSLSATAESRNARRESISPGSAPVAPTGVDDNDEYAERIRSTK